MLNFTSVGEIIVTIQMKTSLAIFPSGTVKCALQGGSSFNSVNETIECDHSNKIFLATFSSGTIKFALYRV